MWLWSWELAEYLHIAFVAIAIDSNKTRKEDRSTTHVIIHSHCTGDHMVKQGD